MCRHKRKGFVSDLCHSCCDNLWNSCCTDKIDGEEDWKRYTRKERRGKQDWVEKGQRKPSERLGGKDRKIYTEEGREEKHW